MKTCALKISVLLLVWAASGGNSFPQVVDHDNVGMITSLSERRVWCAYERLNLHWNRAVFRWNDIEPAPGVFDWSTADDLVRAARELGYELLVNLEDTPGWANGGKPPNYPPDDPETWRAFVRAAVKRYTHFEGSPYSVRYWAVWNEPNLPIFFHGTMRDYVDKIFIPAADVIHSFHRGNRVVGPEFSWHWLLMPEDWNLFEFLTGPAGGRLDVLSLHIWNDAPNGFEGYLDQVIHPVLTNTGWEGRPFWVTETGYPTCGAPCDDDAQAHYMLRVINAQQRRAAWFQKVFLFAFFLKQSCEVMILPDFTCRNWHVRPAFNLLVDFFHHTPTTDPNPQCHLRPECAVNRPGGLLLPPTVRPVPERPIPSPLQCDRP